MGKETDDLRYICEKTLDSADLQRMAGLAMGVAVGDSEFVGARGVRNVVNGAPLEADDVFHCASISKTFTSTGIMKLIDDEKLSLEDRLADLLPYLSIADKRYEKIELHHMLSHISGIHDVEELTWESPKKGAEALKEQALSEGVKNMTLASDPDDGIFLYSDLAYDLLGLIIQETSGRTFEDFVDENFIKPAGMKNTTFLTFERTGGSVDPAGAEKAGMAMPHRFDGTADGTADGNDSGGHIMPESVYPYSREHAPSSTLTSTVEDLIRWGRYNMDRRAVSEKAYGYMQTERIEAVDKNGEMGMGWFIWKSNGHRLIGHEGGDVGFRTSFWTWPEKQAVMVILANTTEAPIEPLNEMLISSIAGIF